MSFTPKDLEYFPENFIWGASTSAHQVEGGNNNSWTEWEKENSSRLRRNGIKMVKEQASFLGARLGRITRDAREETNYISGKAADQYNLYPTDIKTMSDLGMNGYRFGIEWSRIEPVEGQIDQSELMHYRKVIEELRRNHIEPFVTIWHWTMPLWFSQSGGWLRKDSANIFFRYAKLLLDEFSTDVNFWITINEPIVYTSISYIVGIWPPQQKNILKYLTVLNNLAKAHKLVYDYAKKHHAKASIGIAKNVQVFEYRPNDIVSALFVKCADYLWNWYFMNKIRNHQDFLGINFYNRNRMRLWKIDNENKKKSDMGWELYPQGLYSASKKMYQRYKKPVYITETGLADSHDRNREWYIKKNIEAMSQALREGIDIRGYLHWSLLDNFEWDKGFWPRFGLIEVDFKTQKRTVRPSAKAYAEIIKKYKDGLRSRTGSTVTAQ